MSTNVALGEKRNTGLWALASIVAVGVGVATASLHDTFYPLELSICAGFFLFAAFAPRGQALVAVVLSTIPGILGRVDLFSVGIKDVPMRPEEAAALGLLLGHGLQSAREATNTRTGRRWLIFTAVALASLILSVRLWPAGQIAAGALYSVRWVLFGPILWCALAEGRDGTEASDRLLAAIVLACVGLSLLGMLQFVFLPDMSDLKATIPQVNEVLTDPHIGRLVSTVLDPNLLGSMLAPAFVLSAAKAIGARPRDRFVPIAAAVILLVAMLLTVSRGTLLATAVGTFVVALVFAPRLLWGLVALVPLVAVAAPRLFQRFEDGLSSPNGVPLTVLGIHLQPEPSAYARIVSWMEAFRNVGDHPIIGVGYNNYGLALLEHQARGAVLYGTDASLLLILATCGVLGLAAYLWLLAAIVGNGWRGFRSAEGKDRWRGAAVLGALSALLLASIFTNALIYPPVMIYLWVIAGVASGLAGDADQARRINATR